jgi:hypothetical protein
LSHQPIMMKRDLHYSENLDYHSGNNKYFRYGERINESPRG